MFCHVMDGREDGRFAITKLVRGDYTTFVDPFFLRDLRLSQRMFSLYPSCDLNYA